MGLYPLIPMPLADILALFPREAPRLPWWRRLPPPLTNTGHEYGISDMELLAQQRAGLVRVLPLAPTLAAFPPAFPLSRSFRW